MNEPSIDTHCSRLTIALLGMALGVVAGCATPDEPASEQHAVGGARSELSYLNTLNYSILTEFERARGMQLSGDISYPVCIFSNYTTPISASKRESYRALMQQVVNRWNDALESQPGWAVWNIRLYLVGSSTACPDTDASLKVYKVMGDQTRERGYAQFWTFLNVAGRGEFDSENYKRELHEYGHQLGLGDTYSEATYQLPFDQPPGIMNLYWDVPDLTDDDIASVRHVWARLSGRSGSQCPAGFIPGTAQPNPNGHIFCVYPRYDLTSMWLGTGKCIEHVDGEMAMRNCGTSQAQEWRMIPTDWPGYVRLKNRQAGFNRCVDIINNGDKDKLHLAACGDYSGQYWQLVPTAWPGFFQLKAMWLGDGKCLGIINGGVNDQLRMVACGDYSGQYWERRQH
ncbi:RICIN domain-containing protein [Myxococcus xanthus]|uniref:RICIN domain-containing protein n=1 Tax=Myxococcus xanthus TaxID=34 RepID=A0A7Y4MPG8_MYXXA|nr:RICIN domain-containing protein [Myxococcus xanthus]NOJ77415.1 RICIN domain-containing protein [Myxococcus xanthus]NOJ86217.1 RICIN domain-containing protein [Myxococcus xanthus]